MEKIINKGIKIDLHIHSVYSKNKDKDKVLVITILYDLITNFFLVT